MKLWYVILLIAATAGGWVAYPHVYPAVNSFLVDGSLPWEMEPDPLGNDESEERQPPKIVAIDKPKTLPNKKTPKIKPTRAPARPKTPEPEFAPLEELVGNWNSIPKRLFPRSITLNAPAKANVAGGTATLPSGSKVVALSAQDKQLTVSPNKNSKMRLVVDIDKTDFKEVVAAVYDQFKKRKTKEFAAAQKEAAAIEPLPAQPRPSTSAIVDVPKDPTPGQATAANTPLPPKPVKLDAKTRQVVGEAPLQYVDGIVPAMVRSMESGQVKEITKDKIRYWGRIHFGKFDSQPYWICSVDYTAKTIFGIFGTQAKALMRQGKVVKWIYTGSEEPVP